MTLMAERSGAAIYDRIGLGYADRRRPDPGWADRIRAAVGSTSVVNVGAGSGSYEPTGPGVVAIEPSITMIDQRPAGSAPVMRAVAGALPVRTAAFDTALAVLTLHHWPDPATGLAELRRVASRQVVLTWDHRIMARFWLVADYLPEIAARETRLATLDAAVDHLDVTAIEPLLVAADCTDGVLGAYWRRPEAYVDPGVRGAISGLALLDQDLVAAATARLSEDLATGAWAERHGGLDDLTEIDLGYRLVIAGSPG
jgi:SAM-dependent methyltransferase